jgi:hypothetical protein
MAQREGNVSLSLQLRLSFANGRHEERNQDEIEDSKLLTKVRGRGPLKRAVNHEKISVP